MKEMFIVVIFLVSSSFTNLNSTIIENKIVPALNEETTLTGCLLFYGTSFYFYPNTSLEDVKNIFSNDYDYFGILLKGVCDDFINHENYDIYFSTLSTNNTFQADNLNRIHFSEIDIQFEFTNLKLNSNIYPVYNQDVIMNHESIILNIMATIINPSIKPRKILEQKGNLKFREDTEFFTPGTLRFDCR
jgi:hypothetical protein